jgi:hypothetical protein
VSGARLRSQASVAASRRNGARSKGPRSAEGKATSSRNSLKYGLFAAGSAASASAADVAAIAEALRGVQDPGGSCHVTTALEASGRLERVTLILARLNEQLDSYLAFGTAEGADLESILQEIVRLGRYQTRFRGQRDRAMKAALAPAPA